MSDNSIIHTHNLGYPRIGEHRELKRITEAFWKGKVSSDSLLTAGRELRTRNWRKQQEAGIDLIPCNDFSFYDQMLDFSSLVGNVPSRFEWPGGEVSLDTCFLMARGSRSEGHEGCTHGGTFACEMTKWFDTNYHYIVPEFSADTRFQLCGDKVFK